MPKIYLILFPTLYSNIGLYKVLSFKIFFQHLELDAFELMTQKLLPLSKLALIQAIHNVSLPLNSNHTILAWQDLSRSSNFLNPCLPSILGLHTISHLTLPTLPQTAEHANPFYKNELHRLSTALMTFFDKRKIVHQ